MNAPPPMGNGGSLLREAIFITQKLYSLASANGVPTLHCVFEARAHAIDLTFTSVAALVRKVTPGGELAPTWYFNWRNRNCEKQKLLR